MLPKELIKKIRRIEISTILVAFAMSVFSCTVISEDNPAAKRFLRVAEGEVLVTSGETVKVHDFKIPNPEGFKEVRLAFLLTPTDRNVELCEDDLRAKVEVFSLTEDASPYFIAPFGSGRIGGGGVSFPLKSEGARVVVSIVAMKSLNLSYQIATNFRMSTLFGMELTPGDLLAFDKRYCRLQGNIEGLNWLYEVSEGDPFDDLFSFDFLGELRDMLSPDCLVTTIEKGKDSESTPPEDFVRCLGRNLFMFQSAFETFGTPSIEILEDHAVIRAMRKLVGNPRMGKPVQPLLEMDEELSIVKRNDRLVAESIKRNITANYISEKKSASPVESGK